MPEYEKKSLEGMPKYEKKKSLEGMPKYEKNTSLERKQQSDKKDVKMFYSKHTIVQLLIIKCRN